MIVCGIDTGLKGAVCILDVKEKTAKYYLLKYRDDGAIDEHDMLPCCNLGEVDKIYLERTKGRGGWGALQNYSMGANFGRMHQIISAYPYHLIEPKAWQKYAHEGISGRVPKTKSKAAFTALNPSSDIKHDGVIDAFFIARYGLIANHAKFKDDWLFVNAKSLPRIFK